MGYIEYYDTKELQEKASTMDSSVTVDANDKVRDKLRQQKFNFLRVKRLHL